jgi:hypothetical protein
MAGSINLCDTSILMLVAEIRQALAQGQRVCYRDNSHQVTVDMFDELSIIEMNTGSVQSASLNGELIKKHTDFYLYNNQIKVNNNQLSLIF